VILLKISERTLTVAGIIASVVMSSLALGFATWAYYNPKPVPHTPNMPLSPLLIPKENIAWTSSIYPVIVDEKGISVRDFAGITAFFYFTVNASGAVGNGSDGSVFFSNNLTAYARIFLDLQPYRNVTTFLFNNQGRYTGLPPQFNTNDYSVSISIPLVRVTTIELEAFLGCYRCTVPLVNVVVNGTLFY
jgi:hypothetical protein